MKKRNRKKFAKKQAQRSTLFTEKVRGRLERIIHHQTEVMADNRPLELVVDVADYLRSKDDK